MMKLMHAFLLICALGGALGAEADGGSCAAEAQEISDLSAKLAKAEGKIAQVEKELATTEGHVQQMKNYGDTIRGQLDEANAQISQISSEKDAAVEACQSKLTGACSEQETVAKECQRDLTAATGARSQLDKELKESAARIQLLTSDLKQHEAENSESLAVIAELRAKIEDLQSKLNSGGWAPAWIMEAAGPVIKSVNEIAGPYVNSVVSSPAVKEAYGKAKQVTSDALEAAQPLMKQAMEKAGEAYEASQPAMREFTAKSQEAYVAAKAKAAEAYAAAQVKAGEILESEAVANLKSQGSQTLTELKSLLKTQMVSIPSLAPYAKTENINMIVYAILGMPFLFLFSIFALCCTGGKKSRKPEKEQVKPKKGRKNNK